jgi:hypothetical protein
MEVVMKRALASVIACFAAVLLISCAMGTGGALTVRSVSGGTSSRGIGSKAMMAPAPAITDSYTSSGAPDYVVFTLTAIQVTYSDGSGRTAWSGTQDVKVTGSGVADTSSITLSDMPAGVIDSVSITFKSRALMKGSLTASVPNGSGGFMNTTVYTKASYGYDMNTTGGAPDASAFTTGPAEEMPVYFHWNDELTAVIPASAVIVAGQPYSFTLLVDLSRLLRFYNGANGTNAPEPQLLGTIAYFYGGNTAMQSIAGYFGSAGSIQGYSVTMSIYNLGDTIDGVTAPYGADRGWATIILDSAGVPIGGAFTRDFDFGNCESKGPVSLITANTDGSYDVEFGFASGSLGVAVLKGFRVATTIGGPAQTYQWTDIGANATAKGEADLTLQMSNSAN